MSTTPKHAPPDGEAEKNPPPSLSATDQDGLGRALQAHYQQLVAEPLPAQLLAKLAELEARFLDVAPEGDDQTRSPR